LGPTAELFDHVVDIPFIKSDKIREIGKTVPDNGVTMLWVGNANPMEYLDHGRFLIVNVI
jgi:hypothetical protein